MLFSGRKELGGAAVVVSSRQFPGKMKMRRWVCYVVAGVWGILVSW